MIPGSGADREGRATFVDQLRGFSLLGIALVNAPFLAISLEGERIGYAKSSADGIVSFLVEALAQGKFYLLFSFLFGYSVARFIRPETAEGRRRYKRRLIGLIALGLLHAVLFFIGDILFTYGALGWTLLFVADREDARVVRLMWIGGIVALLSLGLVALAPPTTPGEPIDPFVAEFDRAVGRGGFIDAAIYRAIMWPFMQLFTALIQDGLILAAMGAGVLAGRRGWIDDPDPRDPIWGRMRRIGFGVGLPLAAIAGYWSAWGWAVSLGFLSAPVLSAGYIGGLVWLRERVPGILGFFQSAGRMSLTCYLLESIAMSVVFCGWGFGWYGRMGIAPISGIAILVWLAIEGFAKAWLQRHESGPAEALLARWIGHRRIAI